MNKLKEFGKTVFIIGGKAFTSTILQQNCHEFISYESLMDDTQRGPRPEKQPPAQSQGGDGQPRERRGRGRPAPLDLALAMPLVERALQVLERREVQPQLGLLKSTMLQLDSSFSEKAYGASSFSEFIDKLKKADYVNVSGSEGRYTIQRKSAAGVPERAAVKPEVGLPRLRDVLEIHRLEMEGGVVADDLAAWMQEEHPDFSPQVYGFQEFAEFLNFAQDRTVVRVEPDEEKGLLVYLGAEFYPPAALEVEPEPEFSEHDEKQPIVIGQPSRVAPTPEPEPEKPKRIRRKRDGGRPSTGRPRRPRKRPHEII